MPRSEDVQLGEPQGAYKALDKEIHEEYTPQSKSEIRIPLPKKYSAKAISGDLGIIDSVTRMFCVVDRLVTVVRISEVFESFGIGNDGSGTGSIHKTLSSDQAYFGIYCLGLAVFALADEYLYRKEQGKKDKAIQQNIFRLFEQDQAPKKKDELISEEAEEIRKKMIWEQILRKLNNYLEEARSADKTLQEKYDAIVIEESTNDDGEIVRSLVFKQNSRVAITKERKRGVFGSIWEHGIKPFYNAGGFSGFAFWLIWMTAAAATGIQLEGIYGMAPWVGAAVPAGFGLTHLGLYYYNAWKHGGFDKARQHAEAVNDFNVLLKVLVQREHDREMEKVQKCHNELNALLEKRGLALKEPLKTPSKDLRIQTSNGDGYVNKIKDGVENAWVKGAFTVFAGTAGTWGGANSYSWYIKVLIETAHASVVPAVLSTPLIGTVVGAVILGLAGLSGIYNGIKRYREAKALENAPLQSISDKYSLCILGASVKSDELKPEEGKLYVREMNDGRIAYTLVTSKKEIVRDVFIDSPRAPKDFTPHNLLSLKKQIIEAAIKNGHIEVPTPVSLKKFEEHYDSRLAYLEKLKSEMLEYKKSSAKSQYPVPIPDFFNVSEKKLEKQSFLSKFRNHPAIDAFDFGLAGIFVGRVIFTSAAPFLLAPLLPVALAGPIGIAAIVGVGLLYFGMKWYERYQIKKEQRMKQLPEKLEALEKNIKDAELVVEDIKKSQCLTNDDIIRKEQEDAQDSALLRGKTHEVKQIKGQQDKIHRTLFSTDVVKAKHGSIPEVPIVRNFEREDSSKEFKVAVV